MATINITAENFEETITDNDIVLVDFWADWCGPCKRFGPVYEKASEEYDGIVFAKLDTDANYELTSQLGIEGIPTLMAFREGVLVFNQAGALPGQALKQVLDAVKGLDMEEVHAQVAKLQAEHEHSHDVVLRPSNAGRVDQPKLVLSQHPASSRTSLTGLRFGGGARHRVGNCE